MAKRVRMASASEKEASRRDRLLEDLREIVANQVESLKKCSTDGVFPPAMAQTLASVVRTYRALEADSDAEAQKYDFRELSESQLHSIGRGEGTE